MPRRRPVGATVRLTANWWDGERPVEGDLLRTSSGRCYRIDSIRWRPSGTGLLTCTVLDDDAVAYGEPGVFAWHFARRG